jgi:hypothetical protein
MLDGKEWEESGRELIQRLCRHSSGRISGRPRRTSVRVSGVRVEIRIELLRHYRCVILLGRVPLAQLVTKLLTSMGCKG